MKSKIERIKDIFRKVEADRNDRLYECGFAHGRQWAACPENKEGIRPLKELFERSDIEDWYSWFETDDRQRQIKFIRFALLIHPDWRRSANWVEPIRWKARLAKQSQCGVTHPYFMRGFAEGALSLFTKGNDKFPDSPPRTLFGTFWTS